MSSIINKNTAATPYPENALPAVAVLAVEPRMPSQERTLAPLQVVEDDDIYDRFTSLRKSFITATVSLAGFNGTTDFMVINSALPEVAAEFQSTGSIINLSTALYIMIMGLFCLLWGPLSQIYGRRWVGLTHASLRERFGEMRSLLTRTRWLS
jgi:hypothetical protein